MKVLHVVGARPNFMKAGPVIRALEKYADVSQILVHTGQHYDANMSAVFFEQLGLPQPDVNLNVGSDSHARQTAEIMIRLETSVNQHVPDIVLLYGDINSTLAAALVCAKLQIPVGHVEAGLRSFDRRMPEEINRLVVDQIADMLFTPSQDGNENLLNEGVAGQKIHLVGNVMIDTLVRLLPDTDAHWRRLKAKFNLKNFGVVTLHRPSNVDDPDALMAIVTTLAEISRQLPLLFPIHPRTRQRISALSLGSQFHLINPLGYIEFLALQRHASVVITDSGGIQEETTFLGVPCLTLRENTERPITITHGTNKLIGKDMALLRSEIEQIRQDKARLVPTIPLWDGRAAERIGSILAE